jgi:dihydrolipoamide dehydrogenase
VASTSAGSSRSTADAHERPGIYAIGDIVGNPMLAHKATHEGKVAAEVIAGVPGAEFDAHAIPSVAYTDPEVAWMGLTETRPRPRGSSTRRRLPLGGLGPRARPRPPRGPDQAAVRARVTRLLGAGIVGVNAGDLIAETVLALELGADAEDIA